MKETKFKQTEVGLIPSDWNVKFLGNLCKNISSGKNKQRIDSGRYAVYGSTGIIGHSDKYYYDGEAILIARVGANAGFLNKAIGKYDVSDNTLIIEQLRANIDFTLEYLKFYNLNKLVFGSGQPLITGGQVKALQIPLPPTIEEQKRIAQALSDVDAVITTTEKLIAKKKALKQGAMQQLLTGKVRLNVQTKDEGRKTKEANAVGLLADPLLSREVLAQRAKTRDCHPGAVGDRIQNRFKMTEIGLIPEDWEVKRLNEICEINPNSMDGLPSKFIYVDLESVSEGKLLSKNVVRKENAPSRAQRHFQFNDILYQTVRPYQKNNLYVNFQCSNYIASTGYAVLRSLQGIADSKYIYHFIHKDDFVNAVLENCTGTSYPAINPNILGKLYIVIPPTIEEQTAIATVLSDMDTEIQTLETKLAKYRHLKTGMMQQLLTGKVRLNK